MHPNCSSYSVQAFQRKNPIFAFMLTADRLIRCGSNLENYDSFFDKDNLKYIDPVDYTFSDTIRNKEQYAFRDSSESDNKQMAYILN